MGAAIGAPGSFHISDLPRRRVLCRRLALAEPFIAFLLTVHAGRPWAVVHNYVIQDLLNPASNGDGGLAK
jgi:hypothetical protein